MGFFGQTSEELQLQTELDQTRVKLGDTLAQLAQSKDNETRLLGVADTDAQTIEGLREEVKRNKLANRVAAYVVDVVAKLRKNGEFDIFAEQVAQEIVEQRTIDQETAFLVTGLLATEYANAVSEIDLDALRAQLKDKFTRNGAFEKEKKKAKTDKRNEVAAELLAEARADADAANDTPKAIAEIKAEINADLEFQKEVRGIHDAAHKKAIKAQKDEFIELVPKLAEQEVEQGREAALIAHKEKWQNSYEGEQKIAQLKRKLEKQVDAQAEEEVLAAATDTTLMELRKKREAQIARSLEAKILLEDFTTGGIETMSIPTDVQFELMLGDVKESDEYYYDPNYGNRRGNIKTIVELRRLVLASQGEGAFIVNYDSLADSASSYEQNDAIPVGTVIRLGRQQIELGAVTLDSKIAYGVPAFYDTDDTDSEIIPTHSKVRGVKLNGILAVKPDIKKIQRFNGAIEDIGK